VVDLSCLPVSAQPGCTWSGVNDLGSGVSSIEWAIGTMPLASDVQNFTLVPLTTLSASMPEPALLTAGVLVFCTLRVINGAGVPVLFASNGALLIDSTCGELPSTCALPVQGALTA